MSKIDFGNWEQDRRKVLARIAGRVVDNMDAACQMVAEDARGRVAKGRPKLVTFIDYTVTAKGNTVEGRVGVKKKGYWGLFVELGTSKMAARPFLRPAVHENKAKIVKMIAGGK
jgi:HK97 gp10 family phage protein